MYQRISYLMVTVLVAKGLDLNLNCTFTKNCGWTSGVYSGTLLNEVVCGIDGHESKCKKYENIKKAGRWEVLNKTYNTNSTGKNTSSTDRKSYIGTRLTEMDDDHEIMVSDMSSPVLNVTTDKLCLSYTFMIDEGASLVVGYSTDVFEATNPVLIAAYGNTHGVFEDKRTNLPVLPSQFKLVLRAIFKKPSAIFVDNFNISERYCKEVCSMEEFKCNITRAKCIDSNLVCNYKDDCIQTTDENECDDGERSNSCHENMNDIEEIIKHNKACENSSAEMTNSSRCYYAGFDIPADRICNNSQICTSRQPIPCYILCPSFCNCTNMTFKCRRVDVPSVARKAELRGVNMTYTKFPIKMFPYLINIVLSECSISSLKQIIFRHMPKIQTVDLSYNKIDVITRDVFENSRLRVLIIDHNPLSNVIDGNNFTLPNSLLNARIRYSTMSALNNLHGYSYFLDFSFNNLRTLSNITISFCNVMNLSHNSLTGHFSSKNITGRINVLDLSFNGLEKVNTSGLNYLEKVFLQNNRINSMIIQDVGEDMIVHLNLQMNIISSIGRFNFQNFSSLVYLNLAYNLISVLHKETFFYLPRLVTLDITGNGLKSIDDGAFLGMNNLHNLFLQQNKIYNVSENMFVGLNHLQLLHVDSFTTCCAKPEGVKRENCMSKSNELSSCDSLIAIPTLNICIWYMALIAVFANIIVICYRIRHMDEMGAKTQSIFIVNLGCSDLIMGLYLYIIAFTDLQYRGIYGLEDYNWRNSSLCTLAGILVTISSETSTLTVSFISLDRLICIKYPFSKWTFTPRSATLFSVTAWAISSAIALLPMFGLNYFDSYYATSAVCITMPLSVIRKAGWEYSMTVFVGFNFVLFLGVLITQIIVLYEVRKIGRSFPSNQTKNREITLAKSVFAVVLSDMLCWIPIGVIGTITFLGIDVTSYIYSWIIVLVLPINSALNPVLYTFSVALKLQGKTDKRIEKEQLPQLTTP